MVQWGILMVVVMKRNKKKLCPPSVGVYVPFVVESARRYKCGQVQSAQEYIMYLDTDVIRAAPKCSLQRERAFKPSYYTVVIMF